MSAYQEEVERPPSEDSKDQNVPPDDRPQKTKGFILKASNVPPHKRTTALVLCIFLGWCGAHRFYLGQKWLGVLYVVLLLLNGIVVNGFIILLWLFDVICLLIAKASTR